MKKVSVIVPFYKSEKTIKRCMDSILNQTYSNLELVLVNDGSPDNSGKIVSEYAKKDSRIRVIDEGHGGVSSARNKGIRVAKGDYIQFIDSDDYIEPNMFEILINALENNNAQVAVCNYTHPSIKNYLGDCVLNMNSKEDRLKYYQTTFSFVVPWNKLYRRSAITENYMEHIAFCEDELFALSNLKNISTVVSVSDILYHYYVDTKATPEECSCIVKIAKEPEFWNKHRTYWYMRNALQKDFWNVIDTHFDDDEKADILYARMFDFMPWEMLIFYSLGVEPLGLVYEMRGIFEQDDFIQSLVIREKYGIRYIEYPADERDKLVLQFVMETLNAYDYIQNNNLDLKPFHICLNLFATYFLEEISNEIDTTDILARAVVELKNNNTPEAQYVNNLSYNAQPVGARVKRA